MNNTSFYLLHIFVLLSLFLFLTLTCVTQANPHIVKSLPGLEGDLPFTLETGYIGVGEREEVQLFYYFVQSQRDVQRDPLMLWLTGGPGCSAFSGLIYEIGPIKFDYARTNSRSDVPKLQLNPYAWSKVASIIFLDSPVGTGFSYATTYEGYSSNPTLQSSHIYEFITKWLMDHPKFERSPFYASGDSYAGMIIPIVVQEILTGNEIGLVPKINLKGYVMGNPFTTGYRVRISQIEFLHRASLISDEAYQLVKISCYAIYIACLQALDDIIKDTRSLNTQYILEPSCLYISPKPPKKGPMYKYQIEDAHVDSLYYLGEHHDGDSWCRNQNYLLSYIWADNVQVREALNIREGTVDHWVRCNRSLSYSGDETASVVGYHKNFTDKYLQVLVYSGDQDPTVPYMGTLGWIKELQVPITDEWRPWFVDGQVAGYVTEFGSFSYKYRLVFTTIKGGGHTAPEYKPKECFAMIERWFGLASL